jgi:hypothetical protein
MTKIGAFSDGQFEMDWTFDGALVASDRIAFFKYMRLAGEPSHRKLSNNCGRIRPQLAV